MRRDVERPAAASAARSPPTRRQGFVPPAAIPPAVWAIYGEVDPHTVARARFSRPVARSILLDQGHEIADPALAHAARTALAFARDQ